MAKIKKSIWSLAIGIVLCLTLVVGVVAGNGVVRSSNAESEQAKQYNAIMTSFNNYDTSLLADEQRVEDYFTAQDLYDNQLTEEDKQNYLVVAAKARFDEIWVAVFKAPHDCLDRIVNELGGILDRETGVVYSDYATYTSVNNNYLALDSYQQDYVGSLEGFGKMAELKTELDLIMADINAVINSINVTLGEMITDGVVYADKATYDGIIEAYNKLDESAQVYVQENSTYSNVATVKDLLDKLFEKINKVITEINDELGAMLSRDGGVVFNDAYRNDEIIADYDALDEEAQEYVIAHSTFTNKAEVANALTDILADMAIVISEVDTELGGMITSGIKLSDEDRIDEIVANFEALDSTAKAYFQLPVDEQDYRNVQLYHYDYIATAQNAIDAIYDKLDAIVEDINSQIDAILVDGVALSEEEAYKTVQAQVDELPTTLTDADELAYVQNLIKSTELAQIKSDIDAIYKRLQGVIDGINSQIDAILADEKVSFGEEEAFKTVQAQVDALKVDNENILDEAELAYVKKSIKTTELAQIKTDLDAIHTRLQGVIDGINDQIDAILADGVALGEEEAYKTVQTQVNNLAVDGENILDEDELTFVKNAIKSTELASIKTALDEIKNKLNTIIKEINDAIDAILEDEIVKLGEETAYTTVQDKVDKLPEELTDADELEYVQSAIKSEDLAKIKSDIEAIKERLDAIVADIDEDIAAIVGEDRYIALGEEAAYKAIVARLENIESEVRDADTDEVTYVRNNVNNDDLTYIKTSIDSIYTRLDDLVNQINAQITEILADDVVTLSEKTTYENIVNRLNNLLTNQEVRDEVEATYVRNKVDDDGLAKIKEGLNTIQSRLDGIVKEINDAIDAILVDGVALGEESAYTTVQTRVDGLAEELPDPAELAYVQSAIKSKELAGIGQEIQAIKDRLDAIVKNINDQIDAILADGQVTFDEKEAYETVADQVAKLAIDGTNIKDADELKYVQDRIKNTELSDIKTALDAITGNLDAIIDNINNQIDAILEDGKVTLGEEDVYNAIVDKVNGLDELITDPNELKYVQDAIKSEELDDIGEQLQAIKDRLDGIVDEINGDISDILADGVTLSDEDAFNAVSERIENLADEVEDEDELKYVTDKINNEGLTEIETALDSIYDKLDTIVEEINKVITDILADDDVRLAEEAAYDEVKARVDGLATELPDVDEFNYVDGLINKEGLNQIGTDIDAIYERLDALITELNGKIDAIAEGGVTLAEETAYNELVDRIDNLLVRSEVRDQDELDYVNANLKSTELDQIGQDIDDIYSSLDEAADKINDILDRNPELNEDDFYTIQEVEDFYDTLGDEEKAHLEDLINDPYTYEDFKDLANKFLFYLYFKSATEELYAQVGDGYFTVEGYVLENALLSMYHNFDEVMKSMVASCYDKLMEIDLAYETADMLDYNKIKDELLASDAALEEAYKAADGALKTALEEAYKAADEKLKEALQQAISTTNSDLTNAYTAADEAIKNALETANEELRADYEADINELKAQIEELKKADKTNSDDIASLKKALTIATVVLAVVAAVLAICVVALFAKTKKLASANGASNQTETESESETESTDSTSENADNDKE